MKTFYAQNLDFDAALAYLNKEGFVVLEDFMQPGELAEVKTAVQTLFAKQRDAPFDPGVGESFPGEDEVADYFSKNYKISDGERDRLVRRVRQTRKTNYDTPWPVPVEKLNKSFIHVPTLFDNDRSERIWNLPMKLPQCGRIIEDPLLLRLMGSVLGDDCLLSDFSATSIGSHTDGGAWHVDAPLTQLPELPEFPITAQSVLMLDDFSTENGATRVVPRSHRTRKKPPWGYDAIDGEVRLLAPAGSVAVWLSQTWHRSGPNHTDDPRRAVLSYYSRSWVKPFTDFARTMTREVADGYSPTARYLLGWSACSPDRG